MNGRITRISIVLVSFLLSLNLVACGNKEKDHGAMSASGKRIKKIDMIHYDLHFFYDLQGHVISSAMISDSDAVSSIAFIYTDSTIAITHIEKGIEYDKGLYTLTDGLITHFTSYNDDGGIDYTETYRYQDRYLVSCRYDDGIETYESSYTWHNGNIIQNTLYDNASAYSYGSDVAQDKLELWIITDYEPALVLQGYFGNGTTNRLSQLPNIESENGAPLNVTYDYGKKDDVISISVSTDLHAGDATTIEWE